MPQLIAMVIVVVGAMIYMFQTFGGTGDKIEGIAQKTSVITEINNIKEGLNLAIRDGVLQPTDGTSTEKVKTLEGLARLKYFDELINNQLVDSKSNPTEKDDDYNVYKAISFGGGDTTSSGDMEISMVLPPKANIDNARVGLFIKFQGQLSTNAGFLEKQIKNDLSAIASIDSKAISAIYNTTIDSSGKIATPTTGDAVLDEDGMFVIYFRDIDSKGKIKE